MSKLAFRMLSWNLKDFGKYDYTETMASIANSIIANGADIVVLLEVEVNRKTRKGVRIGADLIAPGAKSAISELLLQLQKLDAAGNWKEEISGINAGNADRDAYAFFWRSTPSGADYEGALLPTAIELVEGPLILRTDANEKELSFSGSRRPAGCLFKLTNAAAAPQEEYVFACGFHAYADFQDTAGIKRAITDCVKAAEAGAARATTATKNVVVGGDFNLDFPANQDFYDGLSFTTGITQNGASSLLASPNFLVSPPVVIKNAYDNFLSSSLQPIAGVAHVVNVLEQVETELSDHGKRKISDAQKKAFIFYYPVKESGDGKTSCISDHLPVFNAYTFPNATLQLKRLL